MTWWENPETHQAAYEKGMRTYIVKGEGKGM